MSRRCAPNVNSGSMADIAFLLLIFFLITTTIASEKGIKRQLPMLCPNPAECLQRIEERNLIRITVNSNSELMVNGESLGIGELKNLLIAFIDNNGSEKCSYCEGESVLDSSEHPSKAYISLVVDSKTKYSFYILLQDEITKAYKELRLRYALNTFKKRPENLNRLELKQTKNAYPFHLVEVN